MQFFEGTDCEGMEYILLGADEELGHLHIISRAADFDDAKEQAEAFLEQHPTGGVLINKHMCAVYRMPLHSRKES